MWLIKIVNSYFASSVIRHLYNRYLGGCSSCLPIFVLIEASQCIAKLGFGLVDHFVVSLPISELALSLISIKVLSVPVITILVWFSICRVKGSVTGPLSRANTKSLFE